MRLVAKLGLLSDANHDVCIIDLAPKHRRCRQAYCGHHRAHTAGRQWQPIKQAFLRVLANFQVLYAEAATILEPHAITA